MAVVFVEDAEGIAVEDPVTSTCHRSLGIPALIYFIEDWEALCPKYENFKSPYPE